MTDYYYVLDSEAGVEKYEKKNDQKSLKMIKNRCFELRDLSRSIRNGRFAIKNIFFYVFLMDFSIFEFSIFRRQVHYQSPRKRSRTLGSMIFRNFSVSIFRVKTCEIISFLQWKTYVTAAYVICIYRVHMSHACVICIRHMDL